MTPQLVAAHTFHKRIGTPSHAFRYSVDYILSEPETRPPKPVLLSFDRANMATINRRDHGGKRGAGRGVEWVRQVLAERGLTELQSMRVLLLAQPRLFGYLFNPVSFWLLVDDKSRLRGFIAEVNNTFGQRHSYLCHHQDFRPIIATDTLYTDKVFHVSPFQAVDGSYGFRIDFSAHHIGVRIDHRRGNAGLLATLHGPRAPLTSMALIRSAFRRPFGSMRVVALIYFQALVLRVKGARYAQLPAPPGSDLS